MNRLAYKLYYERHLPHIQPPGVTLFITFRLAGSIPVEALQRLHEEGERTGYVLAGIEDDQVRKRRVYLEQRRLFGQWDAALDANLSSRCVHAVAGRE